MAKAFKLPQPVETANRRDDLDRWTGPAVSARRRELIRRPSEIPSFRPAPRVLREQGPEQDAERERAGQLIEVLLNA